MYCPKCGAQVPEGSSFCPNCGTSLKQQDAAGSASPSPASQQPYSYSSSYSAGFSSSGTGSAGSSGSSNGGASAGGNSGYGSYSSYGSAGGNGGGQEPPKPKKKGIGGRIAILIAVMVAAAAAAGAFFFLRGAADPKTVVLEAIGKSFTAYSTSVRSVIPEREEAIAPPDSGNQTFSVALQEISGISPADLGGFDPSTLAGAGIRVQSEYSLPDQKGALSIAPFYGAADIVSLNLAMNGSQVSVNCPALTQDTFYGLDTSTLGADLVRLSDGEVDPALSGLSFNVFDLIQKVQTGMETVTDPEAEEAMFKAIAEAVTALLDSVTVEKNRTEDFVINGTTLSCDVYNVTIPQAALETFVDAMAAVPVPTEDYKPMLMDIIQSLGLPQETIDQFQQELESSLAEAETSTDLPELVADIKEALAEAGDITFQVSLHDGYVVEISWNRNPEEDTEVDFSLTLGGGTQYQDNITCMMLVSGEGQDARIEISSSGNHSAADGAFTDITTITIRNAADPSQTAEVTSNLRYAPSETANNFSWSLSEAVSGTTAEISVQGQITLAEEASEFHFSSIAVEAADVRVAFSLDCTSGPYAPSLPMPADPVILTQVTEEDLEQYIEGIAFDALAWLMQLASQYPELGSLLGF